MCWFFRFRWKLIAFTCINRFGIYKPVVFFCSLIRTTEAGSSLNQLAIWNEAKGLEIPHRGRSYAHHTISHSMNKIACTRSYTWWLRISLNSGNQIHTENLEEKKSQHKKCSIRQQGFNNWLIGRNYSIISIVMHTRVNEKRL